METTRADMKRIQPKKLLLSAGNKNFIQLHKQSNIFNMAQYIYFFKMYV